MDNKENVRNLRQGGISRIKDAKNVSQNSRTKQNCPNKVRRVLKQCPYGTLIG